MYSFIKKFGTVIHIYEFDPADFTFVLNGETNRVPLSKMKHDWWADHGLVCHAAINAGYFGWQLGTNTVGVDFRDTAFTFSDDESSEFFELVYQGRKLFVFDGQVADIKRMFPKADWAISMGYTLVENGIKSIRKADKFTHSYQKHPRTMIGQRLDGTIVLCATDDRGTGSSGLTANEQAKVMLGLKCFVAGNADGGGSSEMIVDGQIKNNVGADGERAIATALMVYGKPVEEPTPVEESSGWTMPEVIGNVKLAKNFVLKEFACRHCGQVKIEDYRLIEIAQKVRDHFGVPMKIVGFRCVEHNKAIGGADGSLHTFGLAVDISSTRATPEQIYAFLEPMQEIKGLGIYSGHVHFDLRQTDQRVTWDKR